MLTYRKPEVVIIEYNGPLRTYLRLLLSRAGYVVTPLATYDDALCHLRSTVTSAVVIASNALPDNTLEASFFSHVAAEQTLHMDYRYVLLTTTPENVPPTLRAQLARLDVPVIKKPFLQSELLLAVKQAACCLPTTGDALLADCAPPAGIQT